MTKTEPTQACRTCWFSGMEPRDEAAAYARETPFTWTCAIERRPKAPPFVCAGHAPDQERAPTQQEIRIAREFA